MPRTKGKTLIVRMSSLGDVVLAEDAMRYSRIIGQEVDWLVRKEFASVLEGNAAISRVWVFNRSEGLRGWVRLCLQIYRDRSYTCVIDLQRNLRTHIMRALFKLLDRFHSQSIEWRTVSKQRFRTYGFYVFKQLFPRAWRPTPWRSRYQEALGGAALEKINLPLVLKPSELEGEYFCVMPSSRWPGKQWPLERYIKVVQHLPILPVVLGSTNDGSSREMVDSLKSQGLPCYDGVGRWSLSEMRSILRGAKFYLGNDTGLAHMAQSVGTPALVIFGPTSPEAGFGPWIAGSQAFPSNLWCSPCGKDGRFCFRPVRRHRCLEDVPHERVLRACVDRLRSLGVQ